MTTYSRHIDRTSNWWSEPTLWSIAAATALPSEEHITYGDIIVSMATGKTSVTA
jgi:hypothetical protein